MSEYVGERYDDPGVAKKTAAAATARPHCNHTLDRDILRDAIVCLTCGVSFSVDAVRRLLGSKVTSPANRPCYRCGKPTPSPGPVPCCVACEVAAKALRARTE